MDTPKSHRTMNTSLSSFSPYIPLSKSSVFRRNISDSWPPRRSSEHSGPCQDKDPPSRARKSILGLGGGCDGAGVQCFSGFSSGHSCFCQLCYLAAGKLTMKHRILGYLLSEFNSNSNLLPIAKIQKKILLFFAKKSDSDLANLRFPSILRPSSVAVLAIHHKAHR